MSRDKIGTIIDIAQTYIGITEPEIGINGENIALFDYQETCGQSFHKLDICRADGIDIAQLRRKLDDAGIAYVL